MSVVEINKLLSALGSIPLEELHVFLKGVNKLYKYIFSVCRLSL
jgi:hypothetical protein